ncbi:transposase [Thermostichus vulcanus]|uniref:Transposase IS200-like domain-containing protein n=1 Tax=Thermostichus vulcanus str. 'Rupite' TaxID=2813851 RepID=A0ABT0C6W1_THEVL|nr:transposase [Thermostichus vulcanus]MCJ2541532.1 hypothetical protein [Thermostichus vulcanus str. 'Rupite']
MRYDPEKHHRRSIRLKGYDYSQAGAYFVTICTKDRQCLFGEIHAGDMFLNDAGLILYDVWYGLPNHYLHIELDAFVVMPNHIHGIIVLSDPPVGAGFKPAPTPTTSAPIAPIPTTSAPIAPIPTTSTPIAPIPTTSAPIAPTPTKRQPLSEIIRAFKTFSARRINAHQNTTGYPVWQRNYYEHIIRNEDSLDRIR